MSNLTNVQNDECVTVIDMGDLNVDLGNNTLTASREALSSLIFFLDALDTPIMRVIYDEVYNRVDCIICKPAHDCDYQPDEFRSLLGNLLLGDCGLHYALTDGFEMFKENLKYPICHQQGKWVPEHATVSVLVDSRLFKDLDADTHERLLQGCRTDTQRLVIEQGAMVNRLLWACAIADAFEGGKLVELIGACPAGDEEQSGLGGCAQMAQGGLP